MELFAALRGMMNQAGQGASLNQAWQQINDGALLLDVRNPGEFAGGHIEGARNIPVNQVAAFAQQVKDKSQPVVVYCLSGGRAQMAEMTLKAKGFSQVINAGGYSALAAAKPQ